MFIDLGINEYVNIRQNEDNSFVPELKVPNKKYSVPYYIEVENNDVKKARLDAEEKAQYETHSLISQKIDEEGGHDLISKLEGIPMTFLMTKEGKSYLIGTNIQAQTDTTGIRVYRYKVDVFVQESI